MLYGTMIYSLELMPRLRALRASTELVEDVNMLGKLETKLETFWLQHQVIA